MVRVLQPQEIPGIQRRVELVVAGTNHERADVAMRERIAFSGDELTAGLVALASIAVEGVILSTCNRTEVYALVERDALARQPDLLPAFIAMDRDIPLDTLRDVLFVCHGAEAMRHITRVACGLDSLVLGEPHILTQVQDAWQVAHDVGVAGPILSRLCADALHAGKRARTESGIARNRTSIPHAAVDLAARRLDGLRDRAALVVGAGDMASIAARLLHRAGVAELTIANRTPERAERLAGETSARVVSLAALHDELPRHDLVISATAAPGYVIDTSVLNGNLTGQRAPLVALDLGVPRNIDPAVSVHPLVQLYCVDDLEEVAAETWARFSNEIVAAEAIADGAVWDFMAWWRARTAAPTIAALRDQSDAVRERELERSLRKLQHLSERDREVVSALATAITNKLLHTPIAHLREHDSDEVLQLTQELFGLEPPVERSGAPPL